LDGEGADTVWPVVHEGEGIARGCVVVRGGVAGLFEGALFCELVAFGFDVEAAWVAVYIFCRVWAPFGKRGEDDF